MYTIIEEGEVPDPIVTFNTLLSTPAFIFLDTGQYCFETAQYIEAVLSDAAAHPLVRVSFPSIYPLYLERSSIYSK